MPTSLQLQQARDYQKIVDCFLHDVDELIGVSVVTEQERMNLVVSKHLGCIVEVVSASSNGGDYGVTFKDEHGCIGKALIPPHVIEGTDNNE